MTHEVLGDTTVLASEVTALNGHIEGFGGFTADVRPCLALILAALPLVSHPVAFCLHGKGGGAAGGAEEVLRLGRDDDRGLLGKSRQLTAILPAKGPAVAVEVAGRISVAVIGNALAVIRGQQILPIGIFVCVGVGSCSVREGILLSRSQLLRGLHCILRSVAVQCALNGVVARSGFRCSTGSAAEGPFIAAAFDTGVFQKLLAFSSWGLSFNIFALFRLIKSGRCLFVTDGLGVDCAKFPIVIDRLAVLIDGFPSLSYRYRVLQEITRIQRQTAEKRYLPPN